MIIFNSKPLNYQRVSLSYPKFFATLRHTSPKKGLGMPPKIGGIAEHAGKSTSSHPTLAPWSRAAKDVQNMLPSGKQPHSYGK